MRNTLAVNHCAALGLLLAIVMDAPAQRVVAVVPFRGPDSTAESTSRGFQMSEHISTFIAQSGIVKVVERAQIEQAFKEIGLGQTGVIDESRAAETGKMVGATHLIVGSFAQLGRNVKVQARIVDVETGTVQGSALDESPNESAVLDAVSVKLLDVLGVEASYNRSYRTKKALGITSVVLAAGGLGLGLWSNATYANADEEYTTSYNLTGDEYASLHDKAQYHMNARMFFWGGSAVALGAGLYFLVSNKGEWLFTEKQKSVRVVPTVGPDRLAARVEWRW
jgi:TolB-like protein